MTGQQVQMCPGGHSWSPQECTDQQLSRFSNMGPACSGDPLSSSRPWLLSPMVTIGHLLGNSSHQVSCAIDHCSPLHTLYTEGDQVRDQLGCPGGPLGDGQAAPGG